jgi:hypothetical protein
MKYNLYDKKRFLTLVIFFTIPLAGFVAYTVCHALTDDMLVKIQYNLANLVVT